MNSDTSRVSIVKLNSSNYQQWKFGAEMLLLKEDLWELTNEPKPEPIPEGWIKRDNSARATIALSIEPSLHKLIHHCKSSNEMWTKIKEHFERVSFSSKLFLKRKLLTTRLNGNKMEEYINKIFDIIERLRNGGCSYEDGEVVSILLCGLPESYDGLIMGLEAREESSITVKEVKSKLMDEAERREHVSLNDNQQVMAVSSSGTNKIIPNRNNIMCFECKAYGHIKRFCPNINRIRNREFSYYDETRTGQKGETRSRYQPKYEDHGTKDRRTSDKDYNFYTKSEQDSTDSQLEQSEYYSFITTSLEQTATNNPNNEWIIDSGATTHMCNNQEIFTNYQKFDQTKSVIFANGSSNQAEGTGSITIKTVDEKIITLNNAIYVPDMKVNLIAVSPLCKEVFSVVFENSECAIELNHERLITGKLNDGIFMITLRKPNIEKNYSACVHLWHQRLGHRDISQIKKLAENDQVKNLVIGKCSHSDICNTCRTTNHVNKPFYASTEMHSKKVFELVHTDLCGPFRPISRGGGNYMIIITDDYSRYSYLQILKNKYDANDAIIKYLIHFGNKFGYFPTYIRSDGGGEFKNHSLDDFLIARGIKHQYSVPYCPQQNGIAERVNRTILDMTRAMLEGGKLPKSMWGETAAAACYIHNRLNHSGINKIPYNLWEGKVVDFKYIKVLGSKTHSYIPKQIRENKLSNRGREGILIGYSDIHKGYRILDQINNEVNISRSVEFDESYCEKKRDSDIDIDDKKEYLEMKVNSDIVAGENLLNEPNNIRYSTRNNFGVRPIRFRDYD